MELKGETKLEGVRMAMGAFDCPICYEPLMPPIYQCGVGHLICNSCCIRLNKCPLCPKSAFERCFGMERVVESIEVPCCFAENGCTKKMAYFNKKKHEKACKHGPCFCPEPGCGFSGPAAKLPDHFTDCHKWPNTAFKYYVQFGLRLQPGPHVLRAQDGTVFLMNVVAAEPLGHAISLVCVQPEATNSPFGCSKVFSCFTDHCQISTVATVRCSSLADGPPKDAFCVVPKASGGRTMSRMSWRKDDEDESYDEDEEEDNDSDNNKKE
ncbi:hypothetical protein BDA96_01G162900 [Sorghum bicolor]|uniref:RING-type E3 ubiquitin transferase n=2 Tax=Sorghum bicolor TaxID=4558 RepID=A0A921S0T3_SORBI|nr:hypothetical protein BDA96_01G162900 [Sorghum bicolor]KXG37942.1 hypothetical protein SORBI_3001G154800 [Sorghum bicolor]